MAELNLKQIIDKLNSEFMGSSRKLVFWYDDKGEFEEDMQSVELENAKVYFLTPTNQFKTKYFLERVDKTTNYLIYATFPKPDVKENHLEDTMLYSRRFFADRASLLSIDLGIDEKHKAIIEKHIKFFANKERTQRFYDLGIETFTEENILVGLLSAICKSKTCSFEKVVRTVVMSSDLEENDYLIEFEKYELLAAFWKLCEQYFGYIDEKPTLEKLLVTMFVTYIDRYIQSDLPKAWQNFKSTKAGNIIAFLDSIMNNVQWRDRYDELSLNISKDLKVMDSLKDYAIEDLLNLDSFVVIDQMFIQWMIDRLVAEDTGAKIDNLDMIQICNFRLKMHFGAKYEAQYELLKSAYHIISKADYIPEEGFKKILMAYVDHDYLIDQEYRKYYMRLDSLEQPEQFERLTTLVENIYTNEYLGKLLPKWNKAVFDEDATLTLSSQRRFFGKYIDGLKERAVVIISDAMRYEVGKELFAQLQDDEKCKTKMETMLGLLPTYTRLGMAALLPNREIEMTDNYQILVDDLACDNLVARQIILQKYCKDSICVQFDDIKNLKKADLRNIFTGKQVVYVYHNQIDARGDKPNTEDEVFVACKEAVTEIIDLMKRISANANTHRFFITADHGFLYTRDKLDESDKINVGNKNDAFVNRRFIVSKELITLDGVGNIGLGHVLSNDDQKIVSYPISHNVFKVIGGGQNYVHGGSSPQEMLIPVIDVKIEKGHKEIQTVQVSLVSMISKITNLITNMDFIQSEPVTDVMKATTYKMVFMSEDGEKISNENTYVADNREPDSQKRIFRMRFNFKNKSYNKSKQYYLVVYDANTEIEAFRHQVIMDLAFADDFGF